MKYYRIFLLPLLFASSVFTTLGQNPDAFRWTSLKAGGDVVGRHESAFVEYQGRFYLIGGRGINPVNVYNPNTNTWETKSESPMEIHHFQAVVHEGLIYIIGGMTGAYPVETPLENIWMYSPGEDQWIKGAEIPASIRRGSCGAVLYQEKIYIIGGIEYGHTSGTTNRFNAYDLKTGEWESLTAAPHLRDHFAGVVVEDQLYCIGGRNTSVHFPDQFSAFFNATIPWVDVYNFSTGKWITLKEKLPFPTAAGGVAVLDNKLLYIGGEGSQKQAYNHTQCLNPVTGKWSQLAPVNIGRHGSAAILYNNKVYLAAGSPNQGGGNMNSIEVFSSEHDWIKLFNGNNLDGWEVKTTSGSRHHSFWSVDNGMIVCNSLNSDNHDYVWLVNEKEFTDFEIRLKFQVSRKHKGNSGLQFRSRYDDDARVDKQGTGWLDGLQADIEPNNPWRTGLIYDETRTTRRWIFPDLPNAQISKDNPDAPKKVIFYFEDEETGWNDMSVWCKGTHIQVRVNNILVTDYQGKGVIDDAGHLDNRVGTCGKFALQLHKYSSNLIRFKDIEVREL